MRQIDILIQERNTSREGVKIKINKMERVKKNNDMPNTGYFQISCTLRSRKVKYNKTAL